MVLDRGPATSAVTIIFVVIATVFVAGRFFSRGYLVRRITQDDWWMLAAWVISVAFSISIIVATHYGLGRHMDDIPETSLGSLRKAEYAVLVLYNPALMLTKTSIIVFYLSAMSKDVDAVFKWLNWFTLGLVNLAGLGLTLYNILQCMPVSAGYTYPTPAGAKCTNIMTLYLSSAPVNIITDVAILLLPIPILTGLRLPKKQKIILVVTFSFGIFIAVVDVVRLAYLQSASIEQIKSSTGDGSVGQVQDENDFSWYASFSLMWCAIEVNVGCICACVPSLKPLFLRFMPKLIKDGSTMNDSFDLEPPVKQDSGFSAKGDISMLNNPAAFRKPNVKEYSGDDDGDNMGFLNMLAGPDEDVSNLGLARTNTAATYTSRARRLAKKRTKSDFDFVHMSGPRNMLTLTNRQSLWPLAVVTMMFFLWGFAYGLLDSLNGEFQNVSNISTGASLGLHAAYFAGYFVGPLTVGRFVLKRYGFRACMMAGLWIYGCGTLVFWPSAVLTSYTAFVFSNFIVAFGLSCLEIAANPYTVFCGPIEYAEVRLNLSQGFQAIGTVCSPLLATKALFRNVNEAGSLVNVQWAYLGISLFVWILAIIFYYVPLPEASDDQLEEQADQHSAANRARIGPYKVVFVTLGLGVFSQWCYVGAQECYGWYAEEVVRVYNPSSPIKPADFMSVAHTFFAVGRFLAAIINYLFTPRIILLVLYIGLIVCAGVQMTVTGAGTSAVQILIFFFEAGIFAIVFAISLRGLGRHTKTGSALMTAAISGGAPFPLIQWATNKGHGLPYSYVVPLVTVCFGAIFAFYLNFVPAARKQVDPVHQDRTRRRERRSMRQASTASSAASASNQFGLVGVLARRQRKMESNEMGTAHHIERQSQATPTSPLQSHPSLTRDESGTQDVLQMTEPKGLVGDLTPPFEMAVLKNTLLAASVLASSALAAPFGPGHNFQGLWGQQTKTVTDWVTINEQATVWVDGQGRPVRTDFPEGYSGTPEATSAAATTSAATSAAALSSVTSAPEAAASSESASSSTSSPIYSPAVFNSEPEPTTTATTSTWTSEYTTTAAPTSTASTSSSTAEYTSVASTSSTTSASTSSTTSAAATASSSSSSSSSSGTCVGSSSDCVGDITHWDGGLGACGWDVDTSSDMQIALPYELMGTLSNNNPYCGQSLTIIGPSGNEVKATVGDKCMGCTGYDIDLTDILFTTVAPSGDGRVHDIQWYFD
ncbi:hypothetical protein DV737_g5491, partial [Chaetothyriales sp. CBS 132003]